MDENKIIIELLDHRERLNRIEERMFTKHDARSMVDLLEGIATSVKKIEDDHVFSVEWLKRLQDHVERQDADIRKIEMHLKIA